ncbi:hypothetical protein BN938_2669 [Mucinivorans hirudinis]|uniref:Transglutaminase-like domain-containing protein n=1 Tax=Mucinivorans hirudinis TaxID=1433126 RepID=A0A060RE30_9BACT|nr:hypothetical protein BN938_2669 [Mucinivorans hirudinis]
MRYYITAILLGVTFVSCTNNPRLNQALSLAGSNRTELEKVLRHYSGREDSLKLRAAQFLITNMINHAENLTMVYQNGAPVKIDETRFRDSDMLIWFIDSMCRAGQFQIERSIKKDLETIKSDYLIKQIDLAFEVWKKPWAHRVDFDTFCNYILPYRGGREPLSEIRELLYNRYIKALDSAQVSDPVQACRIINAMLKDSIRYDLKMTYVNYSRPIEHIYQSGYGGCDDMCLVGLYVMRAVGIPVAKDFTLWGRMLRGHSWCTVQDNDHQWHAFGAGEDQPDSLLLNFRKYPHRLFAKVYRENFRMQENEDLIELFSTSNYPKAIYNSFYVKDVTLDYCPPLAISLPIDNHHRFSFLCVYNALEWRAVDFAKTDNSLASFENIGTDFVRGRFNIVYAHCTYDGSQLIPHSPPFELLFDGEMVVFDSRSEFIDEFYFPMEDSTITYDFFYWDEAIKNWTKIVPTLIGEKEALFEHIPSHALFVRQATTSSGKIYRRLAAIRDNKFTFYT